MSNWISLSKMTPASGIPDGEILAPDAGSGLSSQADPSMICFHCFLESRKAGDDTTPEEKGMEVVHLPIDGVLDLHTFAPEDSASVVDEYLRACHEKGILDVRVIHGKGKGALRRTVHALLEKHPLVLRFALDSGPSGWGATIVHLRKESK